MSKREFIKNNLKKKPIKILLVCCMLIVAVSIYRYETRYNDRPFYDHKQCEARFDVCEPMEYAIEDLAIVKNYFLETYDIPNKQVDLIGAFLRMQGLETMIVYTYRVEVLPGYAFNFSMNGRNTPYGLKTFGYEYVQDLDETQGLIVGVLHEVLTGKDYPEIRAIFESEGLFTIENDYFYDSSIRFIYENPTMITANFYQPPKYDDNMTTLIKEVIESNGQKDIIEEIIKYAEADLNWKSELILLPYTQDTEKMTWARANWISESSRTIWSDEVAKKVEAVATVDKIDIQILLHKKQTEVKKWQ